MLQDLGLPVTPEPPPKIQAPYTLTCCDEVIEDFKNGCYVCSGCGLVKDQYVYSTVEDSQYPKNGECLGGQSSYLYEKRRYYKPLTHFLEHLRRYLGARFTPIPEELIEDLKKLNLNAQSQDAFQLIKKGLKTLKNNKYTVEIYKHYTGTSYTKVSTKIVKSISLYKEIFTILYMLGGIKPIFNDIQEIKQLYKDFCFFYLKRKKAFNRKNIPSNYMLLDLFLRELGHAPYYNLPYLKNESLKNEILDIFQLLKQDKHDTFILTGNVY